MQLQQQSTTRTLDPPIIESREPAAPADNAPSPAALLQLENARLRAKKIRRAESVARFNGWTSALFAGTSLLGGLFSLPVFIMGAALAVISYNEFAGAKELHCFQDKAARRLGFNQLGFGAVLILYSLWSIYSTLTTPSELQTALAGAGQTAPMLGSIDQLYTTITLAVYGGVILCSLIFQGGTAWYYFSRQKHICTYVKETPIWAVELLRGGAVP